MEIDSPGEKKQQDDGGNSSDSDAGSMNLSPGLHSSDESDHEGSDASPKFDVPKSPGKEQPAAEPLETQKVDPPTKDTAPVPSSATGKEEPKSGSSSQRRKVRKDDDVVVLDRSPGPRRVPPGALVPYVPPAMPPIFPSDFPEPARGPGKYFRGQFGWCSYPLEVKAVRPTSFSDARRDRLEEFLDGLIYRGMITSKQKDDVLSLWITRANALTAPRQGRLDPDHQYYLMRILCSIMKGKLTWPTVQECIQSMRFILSCYLLDMMPDDITGSTRRMPPEAVVPAMSPISPVLTSESDTLTPFQAKDTDPVTPVSSRSKVQDYHVSTVEKRQREVSRLVSSGQSSSSSEPRLPNAPFVDPNTGMIVGCPLDHDAWESLPDDRRHGLRETRHWLPQPKGSALTQHRSTWLCPKGSYCDSNQARWKSYKELCDGDIQTTLSNHRRYAILLCEYR